LLQISNLAAPNHGQSDPFRALIRRIAGHLNITEIDEALNMLPCRQWRNVCIIQDIYNPDAFIMYCDK